jgi:maltose alpha-D-glucosyltransferase / alpha-amylase
MNQDLWYKNAVFYEVYVRAFKDSNGDGFGDLRGLMQKLDYLRDLGIDCIWLTPIFPSPLKDDGYDVADFCRIADAYGTLDDFEALLEAAHNRGIRVMLDFVMNHTSDQHPWFQSARLDPQSPFRNYYVWSDDPKRFSQARIIFLDVETSNWAWDEASQQFYWHRFYSSQPDLNYDNPKVQEEMLSVARFWLSRGLDGLRADAVPYLFERENTNCENLPETHVYLKRLRAEIQRDFPGRLLLCEANQMPEDVRQYFGEGDEFNMGFHFPVMPRMYMALAKGDARALRQILEQTPPIPSECQWCTFLRNHDELTLEMVSEEERQWMWDRYAPEPRMRSNLGIRRRLAPLMDNDIGKIKLMYSMLFTLPGSPIIYYGDEIGMGDNIWLPDRNGVRTPMQWDAGANAGFSEGPSERLYSPVVASDAFGASQVNVAAQQRDPASLWNAVRLMLWTRKAHTVFGWGDLRWVDVGTDRVAAFQRSYGSSHVLAINSLSSERQTITAHADTPLTDLLSGRRINAPQLANGLELAPFEYLWLATDGGN